MLSFASKMMHRMACTQPPLLLQQRLLTTTSSVLGKNSKAPLRPVATDSSKLAGQRRDAHTGVGAVRAMKTMMSTAPSQVGQRAFYRTPQAAPTTAEDQLLAYMSADNYAAKEVKEPQSDKTKEERGESSKEAPSPEEQEVEGLKRDFFETFKGFEFDPSEANEDFTSYGKVWHQWCATVPEKVKKHKGPITLEDLQKYGRNLQTICGNFMSTMKIKVPPDSQLLEATLFLLKGSLQRKFYLGKYLEDIKKEILRIQEPNKWKNLFPCPIACAKEEKRAVETFHVDVEEDCPERKAAQDFFDTSRKAEYVLFIGGESGSGKTHLALNIYTMYKKSFEKNKATETEKKTPYNDSNSHLTVYIRLGANARAEYEDVKNANKKKRDPIEGPDDEEKQRKLSMARNKDVTDLVCKLMCKAVNIHHPEALERLQSVPDSKAEHNDNPKDPMFHATFVVLDEVMLIPDVIKACSPKQNAKGLLHLIRERGMQKLFGTIYIVCSSTATENYYPSAGSFPESVIAIQMGPSPNLFDKLTGGKYTALYRNPFSSIVFNRRCAKYASDLLTVLPDGKQTLDDKPQEPINKVKNGQLVLGKALPNRFKDYFFGYVIVHVEKKYQSVNALNCLSGESARNLLSSAVRTLLTAGSKTYTDGQLFPTECDFNTAVTCGLLEVRDIQDKKNGDQQRIYNVTHAQLLLAVSSYGTNTIALNTPETYEYLCGSMLLFFLNAFARHSVQLEAFMQMIDTKWKEMSSSSSSTETPAEGKKGLTLDFTQTGDVLFPSSTMRFPYIGEEATPVEDTAAFKNFCESLQSYAQNAPVCVMCPPQSPFADCFIVAGKCLFLIRCKHTEKVWGSTPLEVAEELRKMGFECEVTPKATPSTTNESEKKEERQNNKWQNSLLFVGALKEALKLERVIPVFCGTAGIYDTCSEIKARGYGWDVHPMIFNPSISLTATFTRKRNETNWTFHGTKMIPFMGRKRF